MTDVRVIPAGDASWLIELEARLDPRINERAIAIGRAIRTSGLAGVRDVVTSYRSVAVHVDPLTIAPGDFEQQLTAIAAEALTTPVPDADPIRVPVCYGGTFGPDIDAVAAFAGCPPDTVPGLHCRQRYRVYMVGFVPGFAYMGTVDPRIAMPRRQTPRLRVPAGSVGIAGAQTGIYPSETPGGWQIIGRTPVRPFNLEREPPCAFTPGAQVEFYPISLGEFEQWQE